MEDTIKRIKRNAINWENVFAKDVSDKGVSDIYT